VSPWVVDASVGIKWFLPETHTEHALRLLVGGHRLLVPDLFFPEVANILWKRVRRGEMSDREASTTLQAFGALSLQSFASCPLSLVALEIACQTQRSAYDSLYLALAVRERGVMVTADRKLYEIIHNTPLASSICWIEDVP
jgi:predicted nucleic acid-binding protein